MYGDSSAVLVGDDVVAVLPRVNKRGLLGTIVFMLFVLSVAFVGVHRLANAGNRASKTDTAQKGSSFSDNTTRPLGGDLVGTNGTSAVAALDEEALMASLRANGVLVAADANASVVDGH